jgi:DNA-binding transcriptional LysR family regulator
MDSFAGIEAFAAVVERGSFTAAAAALQTAKSSVSEMVRALEERMGVRLLERTTRRVRPTDTGAAFYRHCRRLLDDLASARNEAQVAHKQPAGRLRIAAPDAFAERYIIPGLGVFLLQSCAGSRPRGPSLSGHRSTSQRWARPANRATS